MEGKTLGRTVKTNTKVNDHGVSQHGIVLGCGVGETTPVDWGEVSGVPGCEVELEFWSGMVGCIVCWFGPGVLG